jgi:hypothetical protein
LDFHIKRPVAARAQLTRSGVRVDHLEATEHLKREVGEVHRRIPHVSVVGRRA